MFELETQLYIALELAYLERREQRALTNETYAVLLNRLIEAPRRSRAVSL